MNSDYIAILSNKLQNRYSRLSTSEVDNFYFTFPMFWNFVINEPRLKGMLDELAAKFSHLLPDAELLSQVKPIMAFPENEDEYAALCYFVNDKAISSANDVSGEAKNMHFLLIGTRFSPYPGRIIAASQKENAHEKYIENFIKPLVIYLLEHLDEQQVIVTLLDRYKQKCELFQREELLERLTLTNDITEETLLRREKKLQPHLYEYIHDQGWDLTIEPTSASGEIDLIANQKHTSKSLYIEVKVYHDGTSKSHISHGVNQLYSYLRNYNASIGYLVMFNTTNKAISFDVPNIDTNNIYITVSNKTIFLITIDIPENRVSASKSGKHTTTVFTYNDLVQVIIQESASD